MEKPKLKNSFINGPITADKIATSIANHQHKTNIGGHAIFLGQVRADEIEGKTVAAIAFSTYNEMAEQQIAQIREDIFEKYPLTCMHIYHSLGTIAIGQICFFVFTSSKHRKPAQQACAELVERIKAEVPIWGKEIFDDHTHQWKENK